MNHLTIGQMALINKVSTGTLRLYQKLGLLVPEHVDETNGRRYYDVQQSCRLDLIVHLQQMGFSLDEILDITKKRDVEYLMKNVEDRIAAIEEQIATLTLAKQAAESLHNSCAGFLDKPYLNIIMMENLPERRIIRFDIPQDLCEGEYEAGTIRYYEQVFRRVKQSIIDEGLPLSIFHDVCSILKTHRLVAGDRRVSSAFVFAGEGLADTEGRTETLPGGAHLTVYLDHAYDLAKSDMNISFEHMASMIDYAKNHDMEICEEIFGEMLCRYPRMLAGDGGDMLFRLCLPVRPKKQNGTRENHS